MKVISRGKTWFFASQRKQRKYKCVFVVQSECEQKGESYWYSVTASVVTRIVENIEVTFLTMSCSKIHLKALFIATC